MIKIKEKIEPIIFIAFLGLLFFSQYSFYRKMKGLGKAIARLGGWVPSNLYIAFGFMQLFMLYALISSPFTTNHFSLIDKVAALFIAVFGLYYIYIGLQKKTIWDGGISFDGCVYRWDEVISYEFMKENIIFLERPAIVFKVKGNRLRRIVSYKWWLRDEDKEKIKVLLEKHLPGKNKYTKS